MIAPAPAEALAGSYRALRLAVALRPFAEAEQRRAELIGGAMRRWLAVDASAAERLARRAILAERERMLHEGLLLDLPPTALRAHVEAMAGPATIPAAAGGALALALHHGPFTTLGLWLAWRASRGDIPRLTILFDGRGAASFGLPPARLAAFEAVGLVRADAYEFLDVRAGGAAALVVARLRAGEVVLGLPDAQLLPADDPRAARLRIGDSHVGVPRGAFRAAALAGVPLLPLALRAGDGGYAVDVGPPVAVASRHAADLVAAAESALGWLAGSTVDADPAGWALWGTLDALDRPS